MSIFAPTDALPVMFLDASFLNNIENAYAHGKKHLRHADAQFSVRALIDDFATTHTLIIPRAIYKELLGTSSGRLDMMLNDQGEVQPYSGEPPKPFTHESSKAYHTLFNDYWHAGKLRCYESTVAMLDAGEMSQPRGGIVLVDANGVKGDFSRFLPRSDIAKLTPQQCDAEIRDNYQKGDDRLIKIITKVNNDLIRKDSSIHYLVCSDDIGLLKRVHNAAPKHRDGDSPNLKTCTLGNTALTFLDAYSKHSSKYDDRASFKASNFLLMLNTLREEKGGSPVIYNENGQNDKYIAQSLQWLADTTPAPTQYITEAERQGGLTTESGQDTAQNAPAMGENNR